ncbi:MAG: hypothetical protein ACLQIB_11005 [Isosphaeraceae bacterium]
MPASDPARTPTSRRYRPALEGLEVRELLSARPALGQAAHQQARNGPALNLIVANQAPTAASRPQSARGHANSTPPWVNESLIQSLAAQVYSPVTTTVPINIGGTVFPPGTYAVPQPTQAELRRETFWAEFVGRYSVGPPRFSNQAATIHIYSDGRSAASSLFLNGRGQVLLFPPADPTATPTTNDPVAGQVAGLVALFPANVLQSASSFFLNATNVPGVLSNDPQTLDHGLPSHLEVILDPSGVTSGLGANPVFLTTPPTQINATTGQAVPLAGSSGGAVSYTQGLGVLDIKYSPDNRLRAGATQSGTVIVRMQGVIKPAGGTTNPLYKGIN